MRFRLKPSDHQRVGREFIFSLTSCVFFSRARAGDIKNGYEICSLDTTCSHVAVAWWIDRLLLSMICVGSIPGVINFFLCEKGSKVLDFSIVRGEKRAPEIITRSQRDSMNSETYLLLVM